MRTDIVEEERYLLGSILEGNTGFDEVVDTFTTRDFSDRAHRLIFERMADLYHRGELIDRVTVASELMLNGELARCGGLYYLVELSEGEQL